MKTGCHCCDLLVECLMTSPELLHSVCSAQDAFQLVPTYGELLFHFMCAASGQTAGSSLARQTFVSVAKSMVQLPCGFPRYECYFRIFTHNKQLLHADGNLIFATYIGNCYEPTTFSKCQHSIEFPKCYQFLHALHNSVVQLFEFGCYTKIKLS